MIKIVGPYGVLIRFWKIDKVLFWPSWPWRLRDFITSWMPSFYAVGACDCDTGGRVHAWYPAWFLFDRNVRNWKDTGDGPDVFQKIRFTQFISWLVRLKRAGRYCDRV